MNKQWESIISYADDSGMEFVYSSAPKPHLKLYGKKLAVLHPFKNKWILESQLIAVSSSKPQDLLDLYSETFC